MQEIKQVDKLLNDFSDYGILLYIYASIIFSSMILLLILDMAGLNYISISSNSITIISEISKWVISIAAIIIIFFLMLKAININSIVSSPTTNRFSIFSTLWFMFNLIAQVFNWIYSVNSTDNSNLNVSSGSVFFDWSMFVISLLAIVFQLTVWISLRSFLIANNYGFSTALCKKIRNYLILLIITSVLMLYSIIFTVILNQLFLIPLVGEYLLTKEIIVISDIIIDILLILGYFILGHRFRSLKIMTDVPMNHKTDLQEKTQGDQFKQKFRRYGSLLLLTVILQILFYIMSIIMPIYYLFDTIFIDNYVSVAIEILVFIFQMTVLILLRAFIMKNADIIPSTSSKVIQNSVLLLMIASSVMLFSLAYFVFSIVPIAIAHPCIVTQNTIRWTHLWNFWWTIYSYVAFVSPNILFIIGYSVLGNRLIKLKNSPDVPIYERNKL